MPKRSLLVEWQIQEARHCQARCLPFFLISRSASGRYAQHMSEHECRAQRHEKHVAEYRAVLAECLATREAAHIEIAISQRAVEMIQKATATVCLAARAQMAAADSVCYGTEILSRPSPPDGDEDRVFSFVEPPAIPRPPSTV